MKWSIFILVVAVVGLLVSQVVSTAQADIKGRYRITLMSGRHVEGDVTELADGSYEVKTKYGAIVTVRKNQVKAIKPLAEPGRSGPAGVSPGGGRPGSPLRRHITDEEIQEIVDGIVAEIDETIAGVRREDMMAELPVDEEAVREMLRQAGLGGGEEVPLEEHDHVLLKPHFVMVHTATKESARDLGKRLEAVWRWNVRFMEMMNLPARRPDYKLELYYFADWDEFESYSLNQGSPLSPGVLGYYSPDINRSHFFDLSTMPGLKELLDRLKEPDIPWRIRQWITNRIRRIVEHTNVEVIQHEAGHQIHFNIGLFPRDALIRDDVPVPRWLVEGTTMLFEVPPSRAGASLGVMNHSRLFGLRAYFGWAPLTPDTWKLFIVDDSYWFGAGGWNVGQSYFLGWGMVYYLWKEHRQGYAKYLNKVFGREEAMTKTQLEAEFIECFGNLDQKWFDRFYEFIDKLELRPSLVDPRAEDAAKRQNIERRRSFGGTRGYDGHRGRDREPGGGRTSPP